MLLLVNVVVCTSYVMQVLKLLHHLSMLYASHFQCFGASRVINQNDISIHINPHESATCCCCYFYTHMIISLCSVDLNQIIVETRMFEFP